MLGLSNQDGRQWSLLALSSSQSSDFLAVMFVQAFFCTCGKSSLLVPLFGNTPGSGGNCSERSINHVTHTDKHVRNQGLMNQHKILGLDQPLGVIQVAAGHTPPTTNGIQVVKQGYLAHIVTNQPGTSLLQSMSLGNVSSKVKACLVHSRLTLTLFQGSTKSGFLQLGRL